MSKCIVPFLYAIKYVIIFALRMKTRSEFYGTYF